MAPRTSQIAIDCYMRGSAPREVYETVDTLHEYESNPSVSSFSGTVWPDHVTLSGNSSVKSITGDYLRFLLWAENEGVSLEPAFALRNRSALGSNRSESVLTLPVLCLVVRRDGDIVTLAPHTRERATYTVANLMSDIADYLRIPDSRQPTTFPTDRQIEPDEDPNESAIRHFDQ